MASSGQTRWGVALVLAVAVVPMLAGCFAPEPEPEPTSSSSTTTPTADPSPEPTASEVAAAVTVASVDVDGLNVTVGGLVVGLDESGGTCTFELTSPLAAEPVTATTSGEANAGTTSCGSTQVPVSSLTKGPWEVVLRYESAAETVESPPVPVEVP